MGNIGLILVVFAFVLAVIASWVMADPWWRRLMAASLAFFFAAIIFGGLTAAHLLGR